jgi:hypothetical protein
LVGIWAGVVGAAATATVALGIYAAATGGGWGGFAAGVMFAAAALISGSLFGFLFGVPRELASPTVVRAADGTIQSSNAPNTNLEQVSDWLTKILLGATLTQLGNIGSGLSHLFSAQAPALGSGPSAAVMAGAVDIFMAGIGFLFGWLHTRLFLGKLMDQLDAARGARAAASLFVEASQTTDPAQKQLLTQRGVDSVMTSTGSSALSQSPSAAEDDVGE